MNSFTLVFGSLVAFHVSTLSLKGEEPADRAQSHLSPIPGYATHGHDFARFRALIGRDLGVLWMLTKPSFKPEQAVIIRRVVVLKYPEDSFNHPDIKSETFFIERVIAKEKIREREGGSTPETVRQKIEVTREFALQILDAWKAVLKNTRYSEEARGGLDGTTFQFYCQYGYFGQIWSPDAGLPKLLVDLGGRLGSIVTADAEARPAAMTSCASLAKEIIAETTRAEQTTEAD